MWRRLVGDGSAPADKKVAVIGPTGKVGRHAVKRLVDQGYKPRILLRHSSTSAAPSLAADADKAAVAAYLCGLPGVETVTGDINDRASLDELLRGCSAVLACHGAFRMRKLSDFWTDPTRDPLHAKNVNYEGVKKLIAAARASGTCKRIVRITGSEKPWNIFTILINGLGCMAKAWNYEGERLLRACEDIEYTIIRPGMMRGDVSELPANSLALADNGGDLKVTAIPQGAIADLCVEVLRHPNAGRSTLAAMRSVEPGAGAPSWGVLLEGVKGDRRAFRDDLLEESRKAVQIGGAGIALAVTGFLLSGLFALRAVWSLVLR